MKLIVVCGPTASGKTSLSVALALRCGGEVVSADSMQIYRELNVGTAKPDMAERRGVRHHMLNVASVTETYSVSRYEREAAACVDAIAARGRQPIVCGGTGLYIDALIHGAGFMENDPTGALRRALEAEWDEKGGEEMLRQLSAVDPASAARLHVNDRKRVLRALEVYRLTGRTITDHNRETQSRPPRYDAVILGIAPEDRAVLYERIDRRVDEMLERGLLDEVCALRERGLLINTAAQAIGYKELAGYLDGRSSLEEGAALIKQKTRNYAKRQLTWFRRDPRVNWITYTKEDTLETVALKATKILEQNGVKW